MEKQRVLVKCGGLCSQLSQYIDEKEIERNPLFTSAIDMSKPEVVVQALLDFLQSKYAMVKCNTSMLTAKHLVKLDGAQIILTNTYQASVDGFMKHLQLTHAESLQLLRKSVQLAKEARAKYIEMIQQAHGALEPGLPLVIASIGTYGAHLNDGSEYVGDFADPVTKEELQNWHRIKIDTLLDEGVDGLALETIPCQIEADALVEMLLKDYPSAKFWLSFQCKDEKHLPHGEPFAQAVLSAWSKIIEQHSRERVFSIGVNCLHPQFVSPLFKSLRDSLPDGIPLPPLHAFSNSGEIYDRSVGKWKNRADCIPLETYIPEWIELGAQIVGGCCRVYADDILRIRKCVDNLNSSKYGLSLLLGDFVPYSSNLL